MISKVVKESLIWAMMKGMPQINKSHSMFLQVMWFIGVVTCCIICFQQTTNLIVYYLHYPKITCTTEHYIDMLSEAMPATDVMICNLNPTASQSAGGLGEEDSVGRFHHKVIKATTCEGCT